MQAFRNLMGKKDIFTTDFETPTKYFRLQDPTVNIKNRKSNSFKILTSIPQKRRKTSNGNQKVKTFNTQSFTRTSKRMSKPQSMSSTGIDFYRRTSKNSIKKETKPSSNKRRRRTMSQGMIKRPRLSGVKPKQRVTVENLKQMHGYYQRDLLMNYPKKRVSSAKKLQNVLKAKNSTANLGYVDYNENANKEVQKFEGNARMIVRTAFPYKKFPRKIWMSSFNNEFKKNMRENYEKNKDKNLGRDRIRSMDMSDYKYTTFKNFLQKKKEIVADEVRVKLMEMRIKRRKMLEDLESGIKAIEDPEEKPKTPKRRRSYILAFEEDNKLVKILSDKKPRKNPGISPATKRRTRFKDDTRYSPRKKLDKSIRRAKTRFTVNFMSPQNNTRNRRFQNSKQRSERNRELLIKLKKVQKQLKVEDYCQTYLETFEEIKKYYSDWNKMGEDLTKIIVQSYERVFIDIFFKAFLEDGRLIKFTKKKEKKMTKYFLRLLHKNEKDTLFEQTYLKQLARLARQLQEYVIRIKSNYYEKIVNSTAKTYVNIYEKEFNFMMSKPQIVHFDKELSMPRVKDVFKEVTNGIGKGANKRFSLNNELRKVGVRPDYKFEFFNKKVKDVNLRVMKTLNEFKNF